MMQPTPEKSYHELVSEIRQKDRRFRFFQGLFFAVVLAGFAALAVLGVQQLHTLNEQAQVRSKNLQALIQDNERQTEYIKCIARFFNERNRANANLTDLNQCTIQRSDGSIAPPDNIPPDTQASSSTQRVVVASPEPQPTVTVQQHPPQNPTITVPRNPVTPPTTNPNRQPVQLLGVPVCLPFTNVCVRH